MTPYHADPWLTVYQGDCRAVMAQMEPESVHCVVTSPPYWGLRDYGTATWLGGDDGCDHTAIRRPGPEDKSASNRGSSRDKPTNVCRRCGAVRQDSQLGLEPTPEEYVANMVAVFREVRRVLRKDGTCWVNLGIATRGGNAWPNGGSDPTRANGYHDAASIDEPASAATGQRDGLKPKDLVGIPWRVAFALQADGWYLRSDIIWAKPNPMPESVTDRPTKAHEYLFLLTKSPRYFYDADAVREPDVTRPERAISDGIVIAATVPGQTSSRTAWHRRRDGRGSDAGRNLRTVWTIATQPYPGAHFATFPEALVEPCMKAGTSERGVCPECGAPWVRQADVEQVPDKGGGTVSYRQREASLVAGGDTWMKQRTRRSSTDDGLAIGLRPYGDTDPRHRPRPLRRQRHHRPRGAASRQEGSVNRPQRGVSQASHDTEPGHPARIGDGMSAFVHTSCACGVEIIAVSDDEDDQRVSVAAHNDHPKHREWRAVQDLTSWRTEKGPCICRDFTNSPHTPQTTGEGLRTADRVPGRSLRVRSLYPRVKIGDRNS